MSCIRGKKIKRKFLLLPLPKPTFCSKRPFLAQKPHPNKKITAGMFVIVQKETIKALSPSSPLVILVDGVYNRIYQWPN